MPPRLRPGHRYDELLANRLREHANEADGARNQLTQVDCVGPYVKVCEDVAFRLTALHPLALDELVFTPTHWAIRAVTSREMLRETVDRELVGLKARLEVASEEVRAEVHRWEQTFEIIVPDTSAVIEITKGAIVAADWRHLAQMTAGLPVSIALLVAVVDELDLKKHQGSERSKLAARKALKEIDGLLGQGLGPHAIADGVSVALIPDPPSHRPLPVPDAEIVDRAMDLASRTRKVRFLTADTGACVRARGVGLPFVHLSKSAARQPASDGE